MAGHRALFCTREDARGILVLSGTEACAVEGDQAGVLQDCVEE